MMLLFSRHSSCRFFAILRLRFDYYAHDYAMFFAAHYVIIVAVDIAAATLLATGELIATLR